MRGADQTLLSSRKSVTASSTIFDRSRCRKKGEGRRPKGKDRKREKGMRQRPGGESGEMNISEKFRMAMVEP